MNVVQVYSTALLTPKHCTMLAPDPTLVTQLFENFFSSVISVRLASISISHSSFNPIQPPPDYITNLEKAFSDAKGLSTQWSNEKEPAIISQIPEFFINYNISVQSINKLFKEGLSKEKAIESLEWLKSHLVSNDTTTSRLQGEISKYSKDFKGYLKVIDESIEDANKQISGDRKKVLDLQNQISVLYQDIAAETQKVSGEMSSMATSGAGLTFTLLSYGFAVATAGGAVPVIGILVGVAGITFAAIEVAINEQRIAENLKRITALAVKVEEDDQEIMLLTNMNAMLNNLDKTLLSIHGSVDLGPIWTQEADKLDVAIQELQIYDGDDYEILLPIKNFQKAADAWDQIAKIALNVQKSAMLFKSGGTIHLNSK